jgi:hypothetical protein
MVGQEPRTVVLYEREVGMSLDGRYRVEVKTPVGLQEGSLTLRLEGTTVSGALDTPKGGSEFSGGRVSGNEVTFEAKIRTPMGRMKAHVTGSVVGDEFTGTAKLPLGTAHIHGVRA